MLISTACLIDRSESRIRLEVWGFSYMVPQLWEWFRVLEAKDLPRFILQSLSEDDFQPIPKGWCRFAKNDPNIPNGYVSLHQNGNEDVKIPSGAFWIFLKAIATAVDEIYESMFHESKNGHVPKMLELQVLIDQKIESTSMQGVYRIRQIDNERDWGKAPTWLAEFDARPLWLPFLSREDLFDRIESSGNAMVGNHQFRPRESLGIPVPKSHRSTFVQTLKMARVWGQYIPRALYDCEANPNSKATIAVRSYHQLVDYHRMESTEIDRYGLDDLPFSPDWFYDLQRNLPKGLDPFAFTRYCDTSWKERPSVEPEERQIHFERMVFHIYVDDIDLDRFGFVRITTSYEEESDDL